MTESDDDYDSVSKRSRGPSRNKFRKERDESAAAAAPTGDMYNDLNSCAAGVKRKANSSYSSYASNGGSAMHQRRAGEHNYRDDTHGVAGDYLPHHSASFRDQSMHRNPPLSRPGSSMSSTQQTAGNRLPHANHSQMYSNHAAASMGGGFANSAGSNMPRNYVDYDYQATAPANYAPYDDYDLVMSDGGGGGIGASQHASMSYGAGKPHGVYDSSAAPMIGDAPPHYYDMPAAGGGYGAAHSVGSMQHPGAVGNGVYSYDMAPHSKKQRRDWSALDSNSSVSSSMMMSGNGGGVGGVGGGYYEHDTRLALADSLDDYGVLVNNEYGDDFAHLNRSANYAAYSRQHHQRQHHQSDMLGGVVPPSPQHGLGMHLQHPQQQQQQQQHHQQQMNRFGPQNSVPHTYYGGAGGGAMAHSAGAQAGLLGNGNGPPLVSPLIAVAAAAAAAANSRSNQQQQQFNNSRNQFGGTNRNGLLGNGSAAGVGVGPNGGGGGGGACYDAQPIMMSFKQFLQTSNSDSVFPLTPAESAGCSPSELANKRYNEYKNQFRRDQIALFFAAHKHEEWFRFRYHPEESARRKEEQRDTIRRRIGVFSGLLAKFETEAAAAANGDSDNVLSLDTTTERSTKRLFKFLDAVMIRLEGGNDTTDLQVLDAIYAESTAAVAVAVSTEDASDSNGGTIAQEIEKKDAQKEQAMSESKENGQTDGDKEKSETIADSDAADASKAVTQPNANGRDSHNNDDETNNSNKDGDGAVNGAADDDGEINQQSAASSAPSASSNNIEPPSDADPAKSAALSVGEKSSVASTPTATEAQKPSAKATGVSSAGSQPPLAQKTQSIFFKHLPVIVTRADLERIGSRFAGYKRASISEPAPERRFQRRGWITFDSSVNIRDVCAKINGVRLYDMSLNASINREMDQKVKRISGLANHRDIVRNDLRLIARVVDNMDKRWGLWEHEAAYQASKQVSSSSSSNKQQSAAAAASAAARKKEAKTKQADASTLPPAHAATAADVEKKESADEEAKATCDGELTSNGAHQTEGTPTATTTTNGADTSPAADALEAPDTAAKAPLADSKEQLAAVLTNGESGKANARNPLLVDAEEYLKHLSEQQALAKQAEQQQQLQSVTEENTAAEPEGEAAAAAAATSSATETTNAQESSVDDKSQIKEELKPVSDEPPIQDQREQHSDTTMSEVVVKVEVKKEQKDDETAQKEAPAVAADAAIAADATEKANAAETPSTSAASATQCKSIKPPDHTAANRFVAFETDERASALLDRLILYLRVVHSIDYYNVTEYQQEDWMPNRCGVLHVRGSRQPSGARQQSASSSSSSSSSAASSSSTAATTAATAAWLGGGIVHVLNGGGVSVNGPFDPAALRREQLDDWLRLFEAHVKPYVEYRERADAEVARRLGYKDVQAELDRFVAANCQQVDKSVWLCPLSGKKFKGADYVRKHIETKHAERLVELRADVDYFNRFVLDPKRPYLPEHPISKGANGGNNGNNGHNNHHNHNHNNNNNNNNSSGSSMNQHHQHQHHHMIGGSSNGNFGAGSSKTPMMPNAYGVGLIQPQLNMTTGVMGSQGFVGSQAAYQADYQGAAAFYQGRGSGGGNNNGAGYYSSAPSGYQPFASGSMMNEVGGGGGAAYYANNIHGYNNGTAFPTAAPQMHYQQQQQQRSYHNRPMAAHRR